jgi:hypothetical protein
LPVAQSKFRGVVADNATAFANFRPAGNGSANWGRYQFTPGQVTAPLCAAMALDIVWCDDEACWFLNESFL